MQKEAEVRIAGYENSSEKSNKPLENSSNSDKIKPNKVVSGHLPAPKKADPNSVIDHKDNDGIVDARSFYGANGYKERDLHTTDHGHPKWHNYGKRGEHAHDYEWNDDGTLKNKTTREWTAEERERNGDILADK